jgi:hypothetical protein
MTLWIAEGVTMRTHVRVLGVAAALALGTWLMTGQGNGADEQEEGWKTVIDEATAKELIKNTVDSIQEALKKPPTTDTATRKFMKKLQVHGVLIAVYAQSAKPGSNRGLLIAYRDAGLKLAKAASAGKGADKNEVKQLAQALTKVKGNGRANGAFIPLRDYLDDEADVMLPFKVVSKGGDGLSKNLQTNQKLKGALNGIEEKIRALGQKQLPANRIKVEAGDLALMADKVAAIANLTHAWAPKNDNGKKKRQDWLDWSLEMRQHALDLAKAARKKDAAAVFDMAQKLNSNCTNCHGVFKPE